MPVNTPPSLPTSWTDASVRASNLKDAINDVADAVNKLAAVGYAGWQTYTPTLTATTTNPVLGTGGFSAGRYCKIGRLIVAQFVNRFGTSGQSKGSGTYRVAAPVTLKTGMYAAGATSDMVGWGKIWRGYSSLDLVHGAHLDCTWHVADGATGAVLLGVYEPGGQGGMIERTTRTSGQTGISTSATDITGMSVDFTPYRKGTRVRVTADLHVYKTSGSDSNMYVQVTNGSGTVIRRAAVHATIYGTAFGTGLVPVRIEFIDEDRGTVGTTNTYKVQAFCVDGDMATFASSDVPGTIVVEELPGVSTASLSEGTDYLTDTVPFEWDDNVGTSGGAQMWGVLVAESAA